MWRNKEASQSAPGLPTLWRSSNPISDALCASPSALPNLKQETDLGIGKRNLSPTLETIDQSRTPLCGSEVDPAAQKDNCLEDVPTMERRSARDKDQDEDYHQTDVWRAHDHADTVRGEYGEENAGFTNYADSASNADVDIEIDEQQVARDTTYLVSASDETAEDYTAGPARIVAASDGVQTCAALLLTLDLSAKVQRALQTQRDWLSAKAVFDVAGAQKPFLASQVMDRIDHRRACLSYLNSNDGDPVDGETEAWKEEIRTLEQLLTATETEHAHLSADFHAAGNLYGQILADLLEGLEEPFVHAQLVVPPIELSVLDSPELDIDEELQKLRNAGHVDEDPETCPPSPLHSGNAPGGSDYEHEYVPPTTEQQEKSKLCFQYRQAQSRLYRAQTEFRGKKSVRMAEWDASVRAPDDHEHQRYERSDVFHLGWSTTIQAITREMFEAQRDMEEARLALAPTGITFDDWIDVNEANVADSNRTDFEGEIVAAVGKLGPAMVFGFDEVIRPDGSKPAETSCESLYRRRGRSL
ncbi:hypothetical protein LTR27_010706 [Elasticomyces elasticus]|nr:hypothetical protein LTR27_010706 [Elasticomyces elasticus]